MNLTRAYRALISGLALLLLAAVVPTAASAATCGDDGTTQLFDPVGQYFDFTQATATASHDDPFATLYDSGGNGPADTPPGPRSNSDTYDDWGALFVGGDGVSNMYFSADNDSCSSEEGGAEHVYPVVNLGGLQVQRKIYVHPNTESGGLPGARILNLFTNPGTTPVTTTVQIGDMKSADNEGDLGSDADTAVRSSSSGDTVAAVGDQWFVTSDHSNAAGTENSDPAIAHVMDGPGGLQAVSTVLVGGGTDPSQPQDNVAWRWQITVQPGETAALMSFEAQADVATGGADQATQADALARSRAERYLTEAPAQVYAGMSPAEVSALRNWNDLELAANLTTARKQKLRKKFVATANCPEEACQVTLGGALKVGKKRFPLVGTTASVAAGASTPIALKLKKKKAVKKVKKMVAKKPKLRKKATVSFSGSASDASNTAQAPLDGKSKVKIKKKKKK